MRWPDCIWVSVLWSCLHSASYTNPDTLLKRGLNLISLLLNSRMPPMIKKSSSYLSAFPAFCSRPAGFYCAGGVLRPSGKKDGGKKFRISRSARCQQPFLCREAPNRSNGCRPLRGLVFSWRTNDFAFWILFIEKTMTFLEVVFQLFISSLAY